MPFLGWPARRELRLWRIVWYSGVAMFALFAWHFVQAVSFDDDGIGGISAGLATLGYLTAGFLFAGVTGLCCFWMARLPGGLKGWRIGMLLLWPAAPVVSYLWLTVECFRCSAFLSGNSAKRHSIEVVLWSACLLVLFLLMPVWLSLLDLRLSPEALRREIVPTSSAKRRWQLAAVAAAGYGCGILLGWYRLWL